MAALLERLRVIVQPHSLTEPLVAKEFDDATRDVLRAQAQQEHQRRFEPLWKILMFFSSSMKTIRDTHFPHSPIVFFDRYEEVYSHDPRRTRSNRYTSAAVIATQIPNDSITTVSLYAICEEPPIEIGLLGIRNQRLPKYSIMIVRKNTPSGSRWDNVLALAEEVGTDFQNITPESECFRTVQGADGKPIAYFESAHHLLPFPKKNGNPINPFKLND